MLAMWHGYPRRSGRTGLRGARLPGGDRQRVEPVGVEAVGVEHLGRLRGLGLCPQYRRVGTDLTARNS